MTGGIHPPRAVPRPVFAGERARWSVFACSIVAIAGPAWSIILAAAAKTPEAKPAFEFHGFIRIALAGGDRIAKPGDEHVAHRDVGGQPLGGTVAKRNVDCRDSGAAGAHAQFDFTVAWSGTLPRLPFAVLEGPDTIDPIRHSPGNGHADRIVPRGKIALTLAVSIAALDQIARVIQAKLGNDVLGPTEATTIARQPTLGSEHAVAAARRDHAQKVGLVPKQAEAALHLPGDVKVAEASKLGESRIERAERDQERKDDGEADHAGWWRAIGPFTIYLAAEM